MSAADDTRIFVRRYRPGHVRIVVISLALTLVVGAVMIYSGTRSMSAADIRDTQSQVQRLREDRKRLSNELRLVQREVLALRDENAYLERSLDIDQVSAKSLQDTLVSLQAEIAELREQVTFYEAIVSPEQAVAGVRVLEAQLVEEADAGFWNLEIILVQSIQRDREARGKISASLVGRDHNGEAQVLALAPLLLPDQQLDSYAFLHFQELSVTFELPDGFEVQQLEIELNPPKSGRVTKRFKWETLIGAHPRVEYAQPMAETQDAKIGE